MRGLEPVATALGFGEATALDGQSRRALGLGAGVRRARVCAGRGTLRALLVDAGDAGEFRETVSRAATGVATHSPQLLWLIVAVQPATRALAPATRTRPNLSLQRTRPRSLTGTDHRGSARG